MRIMFLNFEFKIQNIVCRNPLLGVVLKTLCTLLMFALFCSVQSQTPDLPDQSLFTEGSPKLFFEQDGLVAAEAEHFWAQTHTDIRSWRRTTPDQTPQLSPDGDENHAATASGNAYLEILPDTRRTHDDKLIRGENFSPEPGEMAILHYKVHFNTPGHYYVWVRCYSTGTEDNGIHVGLDGEWPPSGKQMQWCEGKNSWRWDSKQRTQKNHCGERYKIFLDIETPGLHTISFSMREDGFEFDKWLMTTDREFVPQDKGPDDVRD